MKAQGKDLEYITKRTGKRVNMQGEHLNYIAQFLKVKIVKIYLNPYTAYTIFVT